MKKNILSNAKFYGIIGLFLLVVFVVETIKGMTSSTASTQVTEAHVSSDALIALPIFSIAIILFLAIPKKNF